MTANDSAEDASVDELPLAVDSLRKLAEGASPESMKRTYFYLNQWISTYVPAKQPWQPDKLIDRLPLALKETPGLERLAKNRFEKDDLQFLQHVLVIPPEMKPEEAQALRDHLSDYLKQLQQRQESLWLNDIAYLQQSLWLHDIAQRISRQAPPPSLRAWLKHLESAPGYGLPEAEQLATAERLFDWTIRNIQLDAMPPPPPAPVATVDPVTKQNRPPLSPALSGEPGPGYTHLPLDVLMSGHGDAHERARIFIQLCRQAGVEAVMLGLNDEASPAPRPWIPGVLIGGQLFLFETGLGVPVPGLDGEGIATLDQVAARPDLLKQLDVEGFAYPITAKDVQSAIALIDAEPAALSRRMRHLQAALPRSTRLVLWVDSAALEPRLRASKTVTSVSLWRVPFEAILYQIGRFQKVASDPAAAADLAREEAAFSPLAPLLSARNLHLQGRLTDGENQVGARSLYLVCRTPERQIEAMLNNDFFRAVTGLNDRLPSDPEAKKATIEFQSAVTRRVKQHATYWLALSYYEEANHTTTLEFLGKRTINVSPPSPWESGARYNLARCYEDLGRFDLARQWLESDKTSPQRAGNLLRAKQLAARQAAPNP